MSIRTVGVRAAWSLGAWLAFASLAHAEATGHVYVKTEPSGARVFLDEETEPRAKTPCLLRDIPAGEHVLICRLEGYADVTGEVRVLSGATARKTLAFGARKADDDAPADGQGEPGEASERDEADEKPSKYVEIDCTVCGGTGLLQEMGCSKCEGLGYIGVDQCADCNSTGRAEHSCTACKGKGTVTHGGRETPCPQCRGKGKFPCLLCRGTGKHRRLNPELVGRPTEPCPVCEGTGFEQKAKCLKCSGEGSLTLRTGGGFGRRAGRGMPMQVTQVEINCPFCGGDGSGPPLCRKCRGAGVRDSRGTPVPCQACFGTGHEFRPCRACAGRGWIPSAPGRR